MATHYSFVRGAPAAAAHMNGPDAMEVDAAQPASQPQQPGTQTPQQPCQVEVIIHAGGITTVGHAMHSTDPGANIATVLAANSGRPGGACRAFDGTIQRSTIHGGHSTQEEDVIANWLLASGSGWSERERLFAQISFSWGLADPSGVSTKTLQHIDYTRVFPGIEARMYADAWALPGQALCRKEGQRFLTDYKYPTTLVFCAGCAAFAPAACASAPTDPVAPLRRPNAVMPDGLPPNSSMRRTFSLEAHNSRQFFEAGAAWAVYAALHAAAQSGCDVVLLPFVSGGLYAGPWQGQPDLRASFVRNIDTMLREGRMPDGKTVPPLGSKFRKIALVLLR